MADDKDPPSSESPDSTSPMSDTPSSESSPPSSSESASSKIRNAVARYKGIATVMTAAAGLLTATAGFLKPRDDTATKVTYEQLSKELTKLSEENRSLHDDMVSLRAYVDGYAHGSTVKVAIAEDPKPSRPVGGNQIHHMPEIQVPAAPAGPPPPPPPPLTAKPARSELPSFAALKSQSSF